MHYFIGVFIDINIYYIFQYISFGINMFLPIWYKKKFYHIFLLVSIELFISIGIHENLYWYQNIKYFFHWYQDHNLYQNFIVISIGKMFQLQLKFKICNIYLQLLS